MNFSDLDESDRIFYKHLAHEQPAAFSAARAARFLGVPWEKVRNLDFFIHARDSRYSALVPVEVTAWMDEANACAEAVLRACQSPIEELFISSLCMIHPSSRAKHLLNLKLPEQWESKIFEWVAYGDDGPKPIGAVFQQLQIEKHRVDFAILGPISRVIIELDGHEFHERTPQQATRDKSRDRRLSELGWTVLRFTGSEVWKDSFACADQVIRIAGIE